jgi:hypothetical protein
MKLVPVASLLIAAPLAAQSQTIEGGTLDNRATGVHQDYDGPPPPQLVRTRDFRGWGRGPLAGPFEGTIERGPDGLRIHGMRGTTADANDRDYTDAKSSDGEVGFDDPWYWWEKIDDVWPVIVEETRNMREAAQRRGLDLDDFDGIKKVLDKVEGDFRSAGLGECGFLIPVRYLEERARRRPIRAADVDHLVMELKYIRLERTRAAGLVTHDVALRRALARRVEELQSDYENTQLDDDDGRFQIDKKRLLNKAGVASAEQYGPRIRMAKMRLLRGIGYVADQNDGVDSRDAVFIGKLRLALKRAQRATRATQL